MTTLVRVIPCLLLDGGTLVKTVQFDHPRYVGDPANVLSLFSEFEVDELVLLDISATVENRPPPFDLLAHLADLGTMPLGYGGGLRTEDDVRKVLEIGFEKVVLNSALATNPQLVTDVAAVYGSQAVVASIDARRVDDRFEVFTNSGTRSLSRPPVDVARWVQELGAGEILLTSIDAEGTGRGYDLELVEEVAGAVTIPVVAHGGAGHRPQLADPVAAGASAVAAGSMFVFQAPGRGVLVNYPSSNQRARIFGAAAGEATAPTPWLGHTTFADDSLEPAEHTGEPADERGVCARCLYDDTIPSLSLDPSTGVCNYCRLHDEMEAQYPVGVAGDEKLSKVVDEMKAAGRGKEFDCIIGVSGGCDSSYLVREMVARGVRPLAVHFDNTWNSPIATNNIYAVLEATGVPLETLVVNNREYDDLYGSFLASGVKDIDIVTDIGFMSTLYGAAERHGIKYIVEGHSFRTEGVAPLDWVYMDGRYIRSVHEQYGTVPLTTFPNMPFRKFVKWSALSGIKRVRPLYFVDYDKEKAKQILADEFGWEWYGGHHLENRWTAFCHLYYLPQRFGIDSRLLGYSALVRSGQLDRTTARALLREPVRCPPDLLALVQKRLGLSESEFEEALRGPVRTYRDFATYKQLFERLRPFFWLLYKLDRVPKSFYVKFCTPAGP